MKFEKGNKTYQIVKALKEDGDLYDKYINREISMKEISEMYDVSYQHVVNIVKENNIGNLKEDKAKAKEREIVYIQQDINNALPIDYIKPRYSMFNHINNTMSLFNSLNGRITNGELNIEIPMMTMHKLMNVVILEVNIMKVLKENNKKPKSERKRISDIAKRFNISYTKCATISSYIKKAPSNLLPNKDDKLIKRVMRNLDIVSYINDENSNHEESIKKIAANYNISEEMVKRIISCEPYAIGADIDEYIRYYTEEYQKQ